MFPRLLRLGLFLVATTALGTSLNAQGTADLLLINGKIITVDIHDTIAEAIAIRGGKILATGTTAEIRRLAAINARIIDLRGRKRTYCRPMQVMDSCGACIPIGDSRSAREGCTSSVEPSR